MLKIDAPNPTTELSNDIRRVSLRNPALLLLMTGVACLFFSTGCGMMAGDYVKVRNHSDSDVTVRLYIADRGEAPAGGDGAMDGQVPLYHTEKHLAHLRVGQSARFLLRQNQFYKSEAREPVIRLWVESRAPVFASDPDRIRENWLELVSFPPAVITVEGVRSDLKFFADEGEITLVPRELWLDRADPYAGVSGSRQVSAEDDGSGG